MMNIYHIEAMVISSFLHSEMNNDTENYFQLEPKVFLNTYFASIADLINKRLRSNQSLGFLMAELEDSQSPYFHDLICGTLPMTVIKRYYNDLKIKYAERKLNGYSKK